MPPEKIVEEFVESDDDSIYASKNMLASLEKRDIMDLQKEIEELENDAEEKE